MSFGLRTVAQKMQAKNLATEEKLKRTTERNYSLRGEIRELQSKVETLEKELEFYRSLPELRGLTLAKDLQIG